MSRNSSRVPLDFWLRILIFALGTWLGCASCAAAQQLTIPENPSVSEPSDHSAMPVIVEPATRPEAPVHPFLDRTNMFLFSGVSIFRGLDYASTRNMQARGREEILLPDDVVNNSQVSPAWKPLLPRHPSGFPTGCIALVITSWSAGFPSRTSALPGSAPLATMLSSLSILRERDKLERSS